MIRTDYHDGYHTWIEIALGGISCNCATWMLKNWAGLINEEKRSTIQRGWSSWKQNESIWSYLVLWLVIYAYDISIWSYLLLWLGIYDDDISVDTSMWWFASYSKGRVAWSDMSRIWNVGLSLLSTTFWLANGRACLYLLFLWCQPWSNFGLEFRPGRSATQEGCDLVLLSGFTYKGMTSLTRYTAGYWCHELCDLKISWRNYGYFENESRIVLIGFGKCEIFSLKDSLESSEKWNGK